MASPETTIEPIRVLVVDDHPVIRGVIRLACDSSPHLAIVGEVATGAETLEASVRSHPDVIVLDVDLPDEDGVATIKRLRTNGFAGKILVLTERLDGGAVLECVRAGVNGYLEKAQGLRAVGSAIMRVATGERLIPEDLEQRAVMELGRYARMARESSEMAASLTRRETEILHAISEGHTMRSIATRLGISPRTVETHVAKLYRKLGAKTRVQAVARAASLGLIEL